ncbi:hypothetical protein A2U01_0048439 [Trifolium medium]|uniref:Uncharacterized protein n=1 Tax=Trifolium medium TaxID=97028 RepID=A0A392QS70_9FABA|nr:hypothetical protein [Trifolium medium]
MKRERRDCGKEERRGNEEIVAAATSGQSPPGDISTPTTCLLSRGNK